MKLPNFLVIGAEKSGTTWLKHNLREHPDIFVPSEKELHFFNRDENWNQGMAWYSQFFASATSEIAIGELTPGYMPSEIAAERIHSFSEDIRIIAILRNPADRAYSNYNMNYADGLVHESFESLVEHGQSPILQKGLYSQQLRRYLEYFSKDQMLILLYEQIQEPARLLRSIYTFLSVDNTFLPSVANKRIHPSRTPRYSFVNRGAQQTARILRSLQMGKVVDFGHRIGIRNWIRKYNTIQKDYEPLKPLLRQKLSKYYLHDIIELENTYGFDLTAWKPR